jgi:hypothetical protein
VDGAILQRAQCACRLKRAEWLLNCHSAGSSPFWEWVGDDSVPHSAQEAYSGQHAACLPAIQRHYGDDLRLLGF